MKMLMIPTVKSVLKKYLSSFAHTDPDIKALSVNSVDEFINYARNYTQECDTIGNHASYLEYTNFGPL